MMTFELIIALSAFAFVGSITPGPNNLMLMTSGINFGFVKTIPHIFGVGAGFIILITMVGFGLMEIFKLFPILHIVLKTIGILYLIFLAWKIANTSPRTTNTRGKASNKPLTFFQGALFQWVNPKAWVMALTTVSAYTSPSEQLLSMLFVVTVYALIMFPSIATWALLGTQMQRFLNKPKRVRIFNFIAAGLLLASLVPIFF